MKEALRFIQARNEELLEILNNTRAQINSTNTKLDRLKDDERSLIVSIESNNKVLEALGEVPRVTLVRK